ncbi:MAG: T9SS type A sorting domain-containing protein [Candidatus Eisenbacteria sp.]|nr:T9SS type A sorting domain-containing protein [Candidatus Eisenbacteria bacterium]
MKTLAAAAVLLLIPFSLSADPGDIIDEFMLPGQPDWGTYGLAKDWDDGNIWAVGMDTYEFCKSGKFHNDTHTMIVGWEYLDMWDPPIWVMDIAYPYEYGGQNCLVLADAERPELRIYHPYDRSYLGDIPINPFTSGFSTGLAANPVNCHLYATNYYVTETREWDGTEWSTFTTYGDSPSMGVAYGWNHVFVAFKDPFKIVVFREDGAFVEEYTLNGWTHSLAGICCAREDAVGENESLYITWTAYAKIREVEVGDFTGTSTTPIESPSVVHTSFRILSLSPNPGTDWLGYRLAIPRAGNLGVGLYDMTGRLVATQPLTASRAGEMAGRLDVARVPAGIYLLRAETCGRVDAVRAVIVR